MWANPLHDDLILCDDPLVGDAVRVFLRDWSKSATVLTHHVARSSPVAMPRMTAAIPRVLNGAESLSRLFVALPSGDLLLAPDTLPSAEPGWAIHSHDSFFMALNPNLVGVSHSDDFEFSFLPPDRFFDVWREIPDVGSPVDPAVLEPAEGFQHQYLIVATHNNCLVGTIRITTGNELGGMSLLAVAASARRSGVGRKLIHFGLGIASSDSCRLVHFQVDGMNDKAIRLYEQLGATVVTRYRYLQRN